MFLGSKTVAAMLVVFVLQGVSGQSISSSSISTVTPSSSISTVTPSSSISTVIPSSSSSTIQTTASQGISPTTVSSISAATASSSSTTTGASMTASVTSPTSMTTTPSPPKKTCGEASFVWKKSWNSMYKSNLQFINSNTEALEKLLEENFFNDSSKYDDVKVSDLKVDDKDGQIFMEFKLCLVLKMVIAGYIEDVVKTLNNFGNDSVTGHEFEGLGVKLKEWKAKDGQCSKCSGGGGGPITIERECVPEAEHSCNGLKTMMESQDCLKYCDSSAAAQKISSVILALGVLMSFSTSFTIWK